MIKEYFEQVLREYETVKKGKFGSNLLYEVINTKFPAALKNLLRLSPAYSFEGSLGKGNFAEVPWIRIFEKEISSSAQEEYYLVYLFEANMQGFYLSLNQGVTQYNELYGPSATQAMKKNTEKLKTKIVNLTEKFSFERIDLEAKQKLGNDYELCHICGKYYSAGNIPDDSVLINDLKDLIKIYEELKLVVGSTVLNLDETYTPEERENIRNKNRKITNRDYVDLEILKRREARMREGFEEATQKDYDRLCKRIDELEGKS